MSNNSFDSNANSAEISATPRCSHCQRPRGTSPSDDFCSPECQDLWHCNQAIPLEHIPYAFRFGVAPSGEPVHTVGGPVPTQPQFDRMPHHVRRLMPSTEETLKALARVAAGLRRLV